jgi:hypothetical protein
MRGEPAEFACFQVGGMNPSKVFISDWTIFLFNSKLTAGECYHCSEAGSEFPCENARDYLTLVHFNFAVLKHRH